MPLVFSEVSRYFQGGQKEISDIGWVISGLEDVPFTNMKGLQSLLHEKMDQSNT